MMPLHAYFDRYRVPAIQNFGPSNLQTLTVTPEELILLASTPGKHYYRPWLENLLHSPKRISSKKNNYQVNLDVQHFAPEELSVRASGGYLVVEGKHEEKRDDHGWVTREFKRRYELPVGCDINAVQSRLSSDGVLTIEAPFESTGPNERVVPIIHTGPVKTQQSDSRMDIAGPAGEPVKAVPSEVIVNNTVLNGN